MSTPRDLVVEDQHAALLRKVQQAVEQRFSAVGFFVLTLPGTGARGHGGLVRLLHEEEVGLVADLLALLDTDRGGLGR